MSANALAPAATAVPPEHAVAKLKMSAPVSLVVVQNVVCVSAVAPDPDVTVAVVVQVPLEVGAQMWFVLPRFCTPIVTSSRSPTAYPDGGVTVIDELKSGFNAIV